jgi:hypothetical protein
MGRTGWDRAEQAGWSEMKQGRSRDRGEMGCGESRRAGCRGGWSEMEEWSGVG